jgi:uncharacterized protein YdhG (YjbR/CyaY superfamily)
MSQTPKISTIDAYLANLPPETAALVQTIRSMVSETFPTAEEVISYQMPAFKLEKIFLYVGAFKKHIGIFPPLHNHLELQETLTPYRGPKGNLKFPLDQPLPLELIGQVIEALAAQSKIK